VISIELNGKRLDLVRSAFPQIATIAALVNPANKLAFEQTETAGRSLSLGSVRRIEAESAGDLRVLRPEIFSGADAALILPEGVFHNYRRDVVALINEARLPATHPKRGVR
jgi:hypothetical protein